MYSGSAGTAAETWWILYSGSLIYLSVLLECKLDGYIWKPNFELVREQLERDGRKKETARKRTENWNRTKIERSAVKELIPETGRTHPHPSPTEKRPHGQSSPSSLTHEKTSLRPSPPPHSCQPAVSPSQFTFNTMAGGSRTVVKRSRDVALEHVRKALCNDGSLLTRLEEGFIRTSCHILGIPAEAMMRVIVKRARDKGFHQLRKVLDSLQSQLTELADRVEKHKRPTPTPACNTRTTDSMKGASTQPGASARMCRWTKGGYGRGVLHGDQVGQDSDRKCKIGLQGHHRPDSSCE